MAEAKICWDRDPVHGAKLDTPTKVLVGLYRGMKRDDPEGARLVREFVEEGRRAVVELARLKRQMDEDGKLPVDWEKFVAPFVKLTAKEVGDWCGQFMADVMKRKAEAARLEKQANGTG